MVSALVGASWLALYESLGFAAGCSTLIIAEPAPLDPQKSAVIRFRRPPESAVFQCPTYDVHRCAGCSPSRRARGPKVVPKNAKAHGAWALTGHGERAARGLSILRRDADAVVPVPISTSHPLRAARWRSRRARNEWRAGKSSDQPVADDAAVAASDSENRLRRPRRPGELELTRYRRIPARLGSIGCKRFGAEITSDAGRGVTVKRREEIRWDFRSSTRSTSR